MKEAFSRARVSLLRRRSRLTPEQQKGLHDKFWQAGESSLYKAVVSSADNQAPLKLFNTVSCLCASADGLES
jgi:hypothetical protein